MEEKRGIFINALSPLWIWVVRQMVLAVVVVVFCPFPQLSYCHPLLEMKVGRRKRKKKYLGHAPNERNLLPSIQIKEFLFFSIQIKMPSFSSGSHSTFLSRNGSGGVQKEFQLLPTGSSFSGKRKNKSKGGNSRRQFVSSPGESMFLDDASAEGFVGREGVQNGQQQQGGGRRRRQPRDPKQKGMFITRFIFKFEYLKPHFSFYL